MASEPATERVWLITGCNSGFGSRLVTAALSRGDRVIATARSLDKLNDREESDSLRFLQLDVTEGIDSLNKKIAQAVAFWGRIDVLVNNAGVGRLGLLEEGGSDLMRQQMDITFFGQMDVTNSVLPYMRQRKAGLIVMVGSRSAWRPELPGLGPYSASKAALQAASGALSVELAPLGIKVLLVEPGGFRTEGKSVHLYEDNRISDYTAMHDACVDQYPRIPGTEKGDPYKAMVALVDVVRGEGVANGRDLPPYLFLGTDAETDIQTKIKKVLDTLDEWHDITCGVSFD